MRRGHESLAPLLLSLTVTTGVVDAVSYLQFGHVFVANMTGNVVFLGFALAGAPGLSAVASLTAIAAFLVGAVIGGRIGVRTGHHRGRHLTWGAATTLLVVAVAEATVLVTHGSFGTGAPTPTGVRYALIVLLSIAMGVQNATARRLGVPNATTTVLTLTLTGLAADSRLAGGTPTPPTRAVASILSMFAGALVGAALLLHVDLAVALGLAVVLLAATTLTVHRLSTGTDAGAWVTPKP